VARNPSDRYEDAATLAEDLRRHLNDLPLRGVRNRSPIERWRKWRRRHPGALAWVVAGSSLLLASAVALAMSVAAHRQRVDQLLVNLEDGRRSRASGHYDEAIRALRRGLEGARNVPAVGVLARDMEEEILLAERGRKADELHELADHVRFWYGIDLPSEEDARVLVRNARSAWERRTVLLPSGRAALGHAWEQRVKADLLELAVVWAELRVRLAPPGEMDEARREALGVLDEADASYGPSLAIDLRRASLARDVGRDVASVPTARAPGTAWEHYDLGRYYLRSGRIEPAAVEFRRTLDLRPQDFWSNFYLGLCTFRLRRFEDAVAAFSASIALVPRSAIGHYNRALAYDALGRAEEASRDYTGAIARDPRLAAAYLNRGILAYKGGHPLDAIADFEQGLRTRPDRETLGRLHYSLALAQLARGDRASARAHAEDAVREGCREASPLIEGLR
jgi:Flp pilus assembly protein TadD